MSLQQLLQQHSQDISATLSHSENIARDNADRKATSLEEKFQHAKDTIEGLGGDIAGGSAAFHMGRKIYKKVQANRASRNQPQTNEDSSGSSSSQAVEDSKPTTEGGGEAPTGADEGGGASRAPTTDAGADPEATTMAKTVKPDAPISADDQDVVNGLSKQFGADHPMTQDYQRIAQQNANQARDASEQASSQSAPDSSITAKPAEVAEKPTTGTSGDPVGIKGETDLGTDVASGTKGETDIAGALRNAPAQAVEDAVKPVADSASSGISDAITGASNAVSKKVGEFAAKKGLSGALDTAGEVLDFLGPVGEAVGIATSLAGLFTGMAHKDKDSTSMAEPVSGATGVDTGALETNIK